MASFTHEIEVGVSAGDLWAALKDQNDIFPKIIPNVIKSIDVLQGEGEVGSVRQINFGPEAHNGGIVKEKVLSLDVEGRTVTTEEVEGGHKGEFGFTKWLNSFQVLPAGDKAAKVVFTGTYEGGSNIDKAIADTKGALTGTFKALEGYVIKSKA